MNRTTKRLKPLTYTSVNAMLRDILGEDDANQVIDRMQEDLTRENIQLVDKGQHMLETLHMAHRFVADQCIPAGHVSRGRLTVAEQTELGRRLAEYWSIKELTPTS